MDHMGPVDPDWGTIAKLEKEIHDLSVRLLSLEKRVVYLETSPGPIDDETMEL